MSVGEGKAKLVVHVPLDWFNRLDALAREQKTNRANVVREALRSIAGTPQEADNESQQETEHAGPILKAALIP